MKSVRLEVSKVLKSISIKGCSRRGEREGDVGSRGVERIGEVGGHVPEPG